ncbi:MAG: MFS transporter [Methanobacteriota archaeon]|nr:MAG: MFS transporter [Euryarchaeota archaeon]
MKPSSIQFFSNAGIFASILFIPIFAKDLGVDEVQLGLIIALYSLSLLVSNYIFGRWADVHGRRKILQLGLLLSSLACITQVFAYDAITLTLTRVLVGLALGMFPSALYAYVYDSKRRIGKFASFGSLGWGLGTLVAGYLAVFWQVFLLSTFFLFLAFLIALILTPIPEVRLKVPFFPKDVIKRNLPVYVAVLIRHSGACAIWVIFPLFLLNLGMDTFGVGILYTINAGTQFVVMQLVDRFQSTRLVSFGIILSALTFISFTFARNFMEMIPTQIMLGTCWATIYVGSLKYIMERNVERATSTGLLNSVLSISSIVGPLLGGAIVGIAVSFGALTSIAYEYTMYAAAVMAVISFVYFLYSIRKKESGDLELLETSGWI